MTDLEMLNELLDKHDDEMSVGEVESFADMRFVLKAHKRSLSPKQHEWVASVYERIVPQYANLVSNGIAPRGKEVPTPPTLQNLPKRPPPRKREDDE